VIGRALLIAVALVAVPAEAQRLGTRIGKTATDSDGSAVGELLAECLIEKRPGDVRRWLDTLPGTAAEQAITTKTRQSVEDCMANDALVLDDMKVTYRASIMRRGIAGAMVRRQIIANPQPKPPADMAPWYERESALLPSNRSVDGAALANQAFGYCIAKADWANSIAMVRTRAGTPAERAVLRGLVPAIGPCMPQGQQFAITPTMIRTVLSEPIYHMIAAAGGTGN